jgi:Zn-dependent protease with chaperone function
MQCPACGSAVPPPLAEPAPTADTNVLAAFDGRIESVRVPLPYRFGILLVAVVMVLLPLLYVALIGLVGYLVYLHAVNDTFILTAVRGGRAKAAALAVYLAPLVGGAIAIVFMFKPLFARPARAAKPRSLARTETPLLFAFVDRVCATVGAPRPRQIDVDCQVNASAAFRRGAWSMLLGGDLTLTLGLPLVAGLNLRQFAGVLAHEFGHFAQGLGMRLTYVIRSISWWFTRVVYERDSWDEWLSATANSGEWWIALVLWTARACVWLTRRILWVLMMVGHAVSGYLLRQMEFDADRHAARVVGSAAFASMSRQVAVLNVALQGAMADLRSFYQDGRLVDDLPALVLVTLKQIPADVVARIEESLRSVKTGLLDTHPADSDRIANAQRENAPGIFHDEGATTILFQDFARLCKAATADYYAEVLGQPADPEKLCSVTALTAHRDQQQGAYDAVDRYFLGAFHVDRPVPLPRTGLSAPSDLPATVARLETARQQMLQAVPAYAESYKRYDQIDTETFESHQALALLRSDLPIPRGMFSRAMPTQAAARDIRDSMPTRAAVLEPELAPFEQGTAARLRAGLELLFSPDVAAKIEEAAAWQSEAVHLLPALHKLSNEVPLLSEVRNTRAAVATLIDKLAKNENSEAIAATFNSTMRDLHKQVCKLYDSIEQTPYPFDHAEQGISIARYVAKYRPMEDRPQETYDTAVALLELLPSLYARVIGRLAFCAERVETALGLPPLAANASQDNAG